MPKKSQIFHQGTNATIVSVKEGDGSVQKWHVNKRYRNVKLERRNWPQMVVIFVGVNMDVGVRVRQKENAL